MSGSNLVGKLQEWCDKAKQIVGGGGSGQDPAPEPGVLMGKLKQVLDGERPPAIPENDWNQYKTDITQAINGGQLNNSDITVEQLTNVAQLVANLHTKLKSKKEEFGKLLGRIKVLDIGSAGQKILVTKPDMTETIKTLEGLNTLFTLACEATLNKVHETCTPAFGEKKPSEKLLSIWEKSDEKTFKDMKAKFVEAIKLLDDKSAQVILDDMKGLPKVFAESLSRVTNFQRGRGEMYQDEELIELSDLEAEYKEVIQSCDNALKGDLKQGRTSNEIANLKDKFEKAKQLYNKTDFRKLNDEIAYGKESTTGSLKYFVAIETDALSAAEQKLSPQEEQAWQLVTQDTHTKYTAFANTNFQDPNLRGVWINSAWKSDFMKKRFKLGRRYNISGVVYTVCPSDTGSTSFHAPIPKKWQWYNSQGKLVKSFIYHY